MRVRVTCLRTGGYSGGYFGLRGPVFDGDGELPAERAVDGYVQAWEGDLPDDEVERLRADHPDGLRIEVLDDTTDDTPQGGGEERETKPAPKAQTKPARSRSRKS